MSPPKPFPVPDLDDRRFDELVAELQARLARHVPELAPLAPGAPLCRAHAQRADRDGLEIALKGGQVGAADFFVKARNGQ